MEGFAQIPTEYTAHCTIDISAEDTKTWLNSPITKALMDHFDMLGILAGIQYDINKDQAIIHLLVPYNVRAAQLRIAKQKADKK